MASEVSTAEAAPSPKKPAGMALHSKIFIGLSAGIIVGLAMNRMFGPGDPNIGWAVKHITEPIGQLFLRLLLMAVIPLVFSSLILGIAGIGDLRKLGRVGFKTFAYTMVLSGISVAIGLGLANTIKPGTRIDKEVKERLEEKYSVDASKRVEAAKKEGEDHDSPLMQVVKTVVPTNPVAAVAADPPNMLHLMFFTVLLGIAITLVGSEKTERLMETFEGLYEASLKIVDIVMMLAPYAVACLLFNNMARFGFELLGTLVWYIATVLLGLAIHLFGVYSLSVWLLARISPMEFFRRVKTVMLTAFSTSSSNASLPTALRVGEKGLGIPREINSFVLTVGATANQNGTALYEGVTVLFLAQLVGIDLSIGQQIMVAYLAILGGVGTAGVPSGSIPFLVVVLTQIHIHPELIAIVLGVDRILDMCRTTLNVTGDLAAAAYVARSEGYELLGEGTHIHGAAEI